MRDRQVGGRIYAQVMWARGGRAMCVGVGGDFALLIRTGSASCRTLKRLTWLEGLVDNHMPRP